MAYIVAQQTNEFDLRMALGAAPLHVVQLVLSRAFQRVEAGLVAGLLLAVGAARFMEAQLFGVSFWDPVALAVSSGSLVARTFSAAIILDSAVRPMSFALHGAGTQRVTVSC